MGPCRRRSLPMSWCACRWPPPGVRGGPPGRFHPGAGRTGAARRSGGPAPGGGAAAVPGRAGALRPHRSEGGPQGAHPPSRDRAVVGGGGGREEKPARARPSSTWGPARGCWPSRPNMPSRRPRCTPPTDAPGRSTWPGQNATANGLEVAFLHGDLLDPLPSGLRGRVELIVANPPYLSEEEWERLPDEIRLHEPREALVAGPAGTEVWPASPRRPIGGWGPGAGCCVRSGRRRARRPWPLRRLRAGGAPDLAGRPRFLVARKGAPCCR